MKDSGAHQDWLTAALAERLLDGAAAEDADGGASRLAALLAAASVPSPGDPEREQEALAAYRQARDARASRRVLGRRARAAVGELAAVLALGGVAVAAQSGTLRNPFHSATTGPRPATSGSAGPAAPVAPAGTASAGTASAAATPSAPVPTPPKRPTARGSSPGAPPAVPHTRATPPGLAGAEPQGLCRAYARAAGRGEAMDAAGRAALEQAAGGEEAVGPYCEGVPGAGVAARPPASGTPSEGRRSR
ncbi:hypothetical protein [Actinacidiphila sp. bgisy167]|uniref:hypothetical protein n=1 Tax=Actinacidiphila sp. bgisy167 TaxID=3413797 RepID=UPI003D726318